MKYILSALSLCYLTTSLLQADIIMGVVPQQSPLKLLKVWKPVADHLSKKTGEKVTFKTEKSIEKFAQALYNGAYDFAYVNPHQYIIAHQKQGYLAKIRAEKNIRGILVMKYGTDIKKLKDKNARYLFPSPTAFAATLLTKYDLIQRYNVSIETLNNAHYVNSHDSVYKGISRGVGDVGGGIERTFRNISDSKLKNDIHIVHVTPAYPSHPFVFKADMNERHKEAIGDALLNIPKSLLNTLSIKKLKKINHSEYDSVQALMLKLQITSK